MLTVNYATGQKERQKGRHFRILLKNIGIIQSMLIFSQEKIISGGSGPWGYSVMSPHPELSEEDAKVMVNYILSLEEN